MLLAHALDHAAPRPWPRARRSRIRACARRIRAGGGEPRAVGRRRPRCTRVARAHASAPTWRLRSPPGPLLRPPRSRRDDRVQWTRSSPAATGFVGANVVRELLRDGATVRVLARPEATGARSTGSRVEIVDGRPRSIRASLARAVQRRAHRVPRGRRLPALGARSRGDLPRQRRGHARRARGRRRGRRPPHRVHLQRRRARHPEGRHARHRGHARSRSPTWSGRTSAPSFSPSRWRSSSRRRGLPVVIVNPSAPDRALGRQADADRPDGRRLHARPDVRHRRHRAQPRPRRATSRAAISWPPSAGRSARSTSWDAENLSLAAIGAPARRDHAAAARRAAGCPYAVAWCGAALHGRRRRG